MKIAHKKIIFVLLFILTFLTTPIQSEELKNDKSNIPIENKGITTREQLLGHFKLGEPKEDVVKELGKVGLADSDRMLFKDNWTAWIDQKKMTLKGVAYSEPLGIKDEPVYPKTSMSITIGSKLADVEKAYGNPDSTLTGKSPFVLRNSELSLIYVYSIKGLWIIFSNSKPYSDTYDWRVTNIAIGNEDVIENMVYGSQAYATKPITPSKKRHIISDYEKKYGKEKELEIFDDYMYALQVAIFDYIKSNGEYIVTLLVILPKDEAILKEFNSKLSEDGPLSKKLESQSKKIATSKHNVSLSQLEQIVKRVEKLKDDLLYEEFADYNAILLRQLQQKKKP
ncbi:MAG: hypothetical protein A2031_07305 [Deltaproteobacteria bacterium RBG_19FT_COMBO_43_11]|nr:MAG: hypothetical protein A2031_07305 [Deltaproteobacteria bacterium RBG_19FT_COMBO_43_11]